MRKIWKGLFYAFWHSDKAPVQARGTRILRPCCDCFAATCTPLSCNINMHVPVDCDEHAVMNDSPDLSDSPASLQAALADRLSAILPQLSPSTAHTYFAVFFRALREEWFGIDRLRLDKFMLLIRRMLRQLFRRLRDAAWCNWLCR